MKRQLAARPTLFPCVFRRAFEPGKALDKMRSNMSQSGFLVSASAIYIAGPCFTTAEVAFNRILGNELRIRGRIVYLPQDFVDINRDIRQQCLDALFACDLMIAILEGPDVDSGTAYEVGFWQARFPDQPVVGYRSDIRRGGDSPQNVNAMLTGFPIYSKLQELLDAIDKL